MAEEIKKVIVLGVELDLQQLIRASQDAQKELTALRAQRKVLKEEGKESTREFEENAAAIRRASEAVRSTAKDIDNAVKVRDREKGSIVALRAELSLATKQYNLMSEAERTGTKDGIAFGISIKKLSDNLKEAESRIGDNRRKVGDYAGAIRETAGAFGLFPPGLQSAISGVNSLNGALLKLVLNPIGAIIAAIVLSLVALYKAFTATDSGANQVKAVFDALGAVVEVVIQRVARFAKGLVEIFKGNFAEGAKQMGDAFTGIGQQIADATSAAYAYVLALDAIEDAQDSFISQTAKNQNAIARLEATAADRTKSTEERRKALAEAIRIGEEELQTQKKIADDKYNLEVQTEARKKGVSEQALRRFIESSGAEAEAQLENNAALSDAVDLLKNEGVQKLENLFAASIKLDTEFFETNKRNFGKLSGFENEENDRRAKSFEDAVKRKADATKRQLDDERAAIELRVAQAKDNPELELQAKIELINKEAEIEIATTKLTGNQKALVLQEAKDKAIKLSEDTVRTQLEITRKAMEEQLAVVTDRSQRETLIFATESIRKQQLLVDDLANGIITQEEFDAQTATLQEEAAARAVEIKIQEIEDKLAVVGLGATEEARLENEKEQLILKNKLDIQKKKDAELAKSQRIKDQQDKDAIDGTKAFASTLQKLFKEGSAGYKAFALLQAAADTASAAIAAFKSTAAIPIIGPTLAPIAAGAAIAFGVLQQTKIASLARGGVVPRLRQVRDIISPGRPGSGYPVRAGAGAILGGQPHSRGGTRFYGTDGSQFEAEQNELMVVINKRSTRMLQNLSEVNVMGGGVPFFRDGGIATPKTFLLDGGFAARAAGQPVTDAGATLDGLLSIIKKLPPPVVAVQDINQVTADVNRVEARAQI